jgi:hypothetical protein
MKRSAQGFLVRILFKLIICSGLSLSCPLILHELLTYRLKHYPEKSHGGTASKEHREKTGRIRFGSGRGFEALFSRFFKDSPDYVETVPGPEIDHLLPDKSAGRSYAGMRFLRIPKTGLQLLRRPPLPEVPGNGQEEMGSQKTGRDFTCPLF